MTPAIPLDQIEVGARYRKDYGDIAALAHSINKNGLITPIALGVADQLSISRETNLPYILLAGGRRMAAMQELGWITAPARIYTQPLTELDLRSIELAENFDRKDMAYAEEVSLMNEINELQIAIHGKKLSRTPDAPGWSQADTAKLVSKSTAAVTQDLKLAKAINQHPEFQLDKCKNKAEAMKRLKTIGTTFLNQAKVKEYVASVDNRKFDKLSSAYMVKDCFEVFSTIPANSLNFIEIDPPYAIDLTNIKKDNDCIGYNEIKASAYQELMRQVFQESYRTLKEGSWLVCWLAIDPWFDSILTWLRDAGFKLNALPGLWIKPSGQTLSPETYLANTYECFFYARKGTAKLYTPGRNNTFQFKAVSPSLKRHPTQRPLQLMMEIFKVFCPPNSMAFVPFLGSGVSIIAGDALSVNTIGTDLNQEYKNGYILSLKEYLNGQ